MSNRTPISEAYNIDCMDFMRGCKDKEFDLAVVDPPYGIDRDGGETGKNWKQYSKKGWDNKRPGGEYFQELRRVSKNQIIWGGNYYPEHLIASMGWIFWDKGQDLTMSDGELAFTSFDCALRRVIINRCKISENGGNIHPTQKPVALYRWIFAKYARPGHRILDTHLGSGSSRIAAYDMGLDFYATELDPDYFAAMEKRFQAHIAKPQLFTPEQQYTFKQAELFTPETLEK